MGKFLQVVGSWLGAIAGLELIWRSLKIQDPPVIWAFSVATFFAVFYLGVWICALRVSVYKSRLDDCAAAKKRLEEQILKNRKSSKQSRP